MHQGMAEGVRQEVAAACRNAQIELEDMAGKITNQPNSGDLDAERSISDAVYHIGMATGRLKQAADVLYRDDGGTLK